MFQDVIAHSFLDAFHREFLAERAGHQDERRIYPQFLRQRQYVDSGPPGEPVVGQDYVELAGLGRLDEFRSRTGKDWLELQFRSPQLAQAQLDVVRVMLNDEDPCGRGGRGQHL